MASGGPAEQTVSGYRGRFAPSPTGPLHFGSLLAALASHADARAQGGVWLLRIEDLDRQREVPGAAAALLTTLRAFGFEWDEPPLYQQGRLAAYEAVLEQLRQRGLLYPCACSRAEVARAGRPGLEGPIYPGTCRAGLPAGRLPRAWRLRAEGPPIAFLDRIQGRQTQLVAHAVGDIVLRRADGPPAYQLAVVVDDAWQGITDVVRGADLLVSTPRQIRLQRLLGLPTPRYAHPPLVLGPDGRKLSKSLGAAPVDPKDPLPALRLAWRWLGQADLGRCPTPAVFWRRAIGAWNLRRIPACLALAAPLAAEGAQVGGERLA